MSIRIAVSQRGPMRALASQGILATDCHAQLKAILLQKLGPEHAALLAEPQALLLDEPFSRLDKPLRAAFRALVFEQIRMLAIPAILVTHDEEDAPGTILDLTLSIPVCRGS